MFSRLIKLFLLLTKPFLSLANVVFTVLFMSGLMLSQNIYANVQDGLPDIGTTAGNTLSINQELAMGDFYVRELRAGAPLIYDPLLSNYINHLGQRLVANADSVRMPFSFYLLRNNDINAFAFFGGNVVLHSALFRETDNESQLASVIAHEISHVTQRHLARSMEQQSRNAPLTWVSTLGAVLLAMANPEAGMAALATTLAGTQQGVISFTQQNEQEADRIGIRILSRAGFDPQAMPAFMQKLADKYRYASKPPEILLTHPLPDSRLSDTRNRANQMPAQKVNSSQDYYLAKMRVMGMYNKSNDSVVRDALLIEYAKGSPQEQLAAKYGQAIRLYQAQKFDEARQILQPLLTQQPNNLWFIDLMTDIDIGQDRTAQAVNRLQAALVGQPNNPILQLNLANALISAGQPTNAITLLNRYTFAHPNDANGWDLLAQAAANRGLRNEELAARAESLALSGQLEQAISTLSSASSIVKTGSLEQARYDARIDQLRHLQQRFHNYKS